MVDMGEAVGGLMGLAIGVAVTKKVVDTINRKPKKKKKIDYNDEMIKHERRSARKFGGVF